MEDFGKVFQAGLGQNSLVPALEEQLLVLWILKRVLVMLDELDFFWINDHAVVRRLVFVILYH